VSTFLKFKALFATFDSYIYRWGGIIQHLNVDRIEDLKNLPRPRHINTHLPIFLLPDQLWTVKPKVSNKNKVN